MGDEKLFEYWDLHKSIALDLPFHFELFKPP